MLNEKNPLITLSENCDIICEFCPNRIGKECTSEHKVRDIDERCLNAYHLDFGDTILWSELKKLAFETVINQSRLKSVCQDCQWYHLCEKRNVESGIEFHTATLITNH